MTKPKNVLVLMCDHHRFDSLSCLGSPLADTPNLDRLAARSVRFENCFTQSPLCAPARYSLATGRYVHAHGVLTNFHKPYLRMRTIAHALQPLRYRRFHMGHMHWTDAGMDNGYEPLLSDQLKWRQTLPPEAQKRWDWEVQRTTCVTTAGPSPRTREQYWGYDVATNAVQQIELAVAQGEPFLCWAAFTEPHPPFYPPRDVYARIDHASIQLPDQPPPDALPPHEEILRRRRRWAHLTEVEVRQIIAGYYGMVALVDDYLGMVINALDRLGIADNTIIIWTVDHGEQLWEHQVFGKSVMREASVRVPLLIYVPGGEPGVRRELVEQVDVFPTICEMVEAEIPDSVQGRSLAPLLAGEPTSAGWRDAVFSQFGDVKMIRTDRWKLNAYRGEFGELYDIAQDPREFYNLIADPAHADTVDSLHERLERWQMTQR